MSVETLAVARRSRGEGAVRGSLREPRAPVLVLAGGALLVAIGAALVAARVTAFALDETLIQQSAVHYTSNLPHSLFHDLDARATNRLYPLLLSIAFRLFNGASAVRVDHVLSVILFVSAAAPVYLMARIVLRSRWSATWVALLSVAVPWLTLSSALFTENLSYPLFWWMLLAVCRAVWRPSPVRDIVALISIALLVCTRVQFAAVFVGYLLALLAMSLWRADRARGIWPRLRSAAAAALRGYPVALALLAVAIGAIGYARASGQWRAHVEQLLGTYSNVVIRNGLPNNMAEGMLVELIALALGVGLLPAIVSLTWFTKRMARPKLDRRWVYVAVCGVVMVVFVALTVYSQGGYLGAVTEERYFFYVVPAFWLGAFAALEDRNVRAAELLVATLALVLLFAAIPFLSPLTQERAFLAPAESAVPHILTRRLLQLGLTGLSIQDALALLAALGGILTALIWQRRPGARLGWTIGFAAALQLLLAGYCYAVIDGKVNGIRGRTEGSVAALGWVDRHAGSATVAWLDNLSAAAPPTSLASASADQTRTTLFWNSRVRARLELPEIGLPPVEWPMSALSDFGQLSVDHATGQLQPAAAAADASEVVGATNSAFVQLAGRPLARSPDGVLTLTRLAKPRRVTWLAEGLQPDGSVAAGLPVRVAAFQARSGTAQEVAVTLLLAGPPVPGASGEVSIRFGLEQMRVRLNGGPPARAVRLLLCFPPDHNAIAGTLTAGPSLPLAGRTVAGILEGVALSPASTRSARCGR